MGLIKFFKIDFAVTFIALIVATLYGGTKGLYTFLILIVLEIVFSFDNAGVNAKYIAKLSHAWRKIFLTVGVLIAVFGMRLIFPFIIVCTAGRISPWDAWSLAMKKGDPDVPGTYGYILEQAHPMIASFGAAFLMMLFLNYIFDDEKDSHWLKWIERPLSKAGKFDSVSTLVVGIIIILASSFLVHGDESSTVLFSGLLGILVYIASNGFATLMEAKQEEEDEKIANTTLLVGKAAFSMFIFLEVLDASFSFDGVLGAFAITSDPILIALGLGVGALFVRSMTIYLVEKGTLEEFQYLENGAHWAIGVLATLLFATLKWDIPDYIIGLSGIVFIAASLWSSVRENKKNEILGESNEQPVLTE